VKRELTFCKRKSKSSSLKSRKDSSKMKKMLVERRREYDNVVNINTNPSLTKLAMKNTIHYTLKYCRRGFETERHTKILRVSRDRAQQCIDDAFDYAKQRWDASHTPPSFKVGDQVLVSTQHFGFSGPRKLHEHFAGPFPITRLIGDNAIEVTLTGEYARKHPVFPVSLCKKYREADPEQFPNRPTPPPPAPDIIDDESEWEVEHILDERTIKKARGRIEREYHVRWKGYDSSHDLWLPEENLAHSKAAIRAFRLSRRNGKSHWQNTSPLNDD
jgi:hypothetical protein